MKSYFIYVFLFIFLFSFEGCKRFSKNPCKNWEGKLHNPVKARDAIRNLGDYKCKESIPALEALFDEGQYLSEILQTIKQIQSPEDSVSILRKGLNSLEVGRLSASIIEDWKITALKKDLVNLVSSGKNPKLRKNVLKALMSIDQPQNYEDLLISLLKADPNVQGIEVNVIATEKLGEIKSQKAIDALILGLFIQTVRGEKMYTPCRKALVAIGPSAIPKLIETLNGNNNDVRDYAKNAGIYEWQWKDGPEIIQVLGDMMDKRVEGVLIDNLGKKLEPPLGVEDRVQELWKITQQNRITMCMIGLGKIGDDGIVDKAKEIILNKENDAKQRLDTATTLALIGTQKSIEALIDIYKKETDPRFKEPLLLPIVIGLSADYVDGFSKIMEKEKSKLVLERWKGENPDAKEVQEYFQTVKECAKDYKCYINKLKEGTITEKKKSALMLSRLEGDKNEMLHSLFNAYPNTSLQDIDLRRFILMSIGKLGDKNVVPQLKSLYESDRRTKGGALYWAEEIEMMINAMGRKGS